ncbi:MAG: chemotaxis protein CheW [Candidatus Zixiibacteriota bacterium]|nr:MAG: chemotaxis protein CheW [candidate division Zixibacteria bacterium]
MDIKKNNSEVESLSNLIQLVSFKLGKEVFGIDILLVQEINRLIEITKIPQAPFYCEGVINLRGKVIPVINLRKKFELESKEWDRSTRILVCNVGDSVIGMIVDSVEEVLKIPKSTLEQTPDIVSSVNSDYIEGIAKQEDQLLMYLNVAKIASDASELIDSVVEEEQLV